MVMDVSLRPLNIRCTVRHRSLASASVAGFDPMQITHNQATMQTEAHYELRGDTSCAVQAEQKHESQASRTSRFCGAGGEGGGRRSPRVKNNSPLYIWPSTVVLVWRYTRNHEKAAKNAAMQT